MSVKENLIAAKALIDTPEKWLPGWAFGLTEDGKYAVYQAVCAVAIADPDLMGSMAQMCSALDDAVPPELVLDEHSGLREYIQYLDVYYPTHDAVMRLFERAIEASE